MRFASATAPPPAHTLTKIRHAVHLVAFNRFGWPLQQHRDGNCVSMRFATANVAGSTEEHDLPEAAAEALVRSQQQKVQPQPPRRSKAEHELATAQLLSAGAANSLGVYYVHNTEVANFSKRAIAAMVREMKEEFGEDIFQRGYFTEADLLDITAGIPCPVVRPNGEVEHISVILLTVAMPCREDRYDLLPFPMLEGTGGWFIHPAEMDDLRQVGKNTRVTCVIHQFARNWAKGKQLMWELDRRIDSAIAPLPYIQLILGYPRPRCVGRAHTFGKTLAHLPSRQLAPTR